MEPPPADAPPPPPARARKEYAPLAFVQRLRNRPGVLACAHCGAFAGGEKRALVQCAAKRLPRDAEELEEALRAQGLPPVPADTVHYCVLGCGETYCSKACDAASIKAGHASLCVGPREADDPLVAFRRAAAASPRADEILLAAKLAARAAAEPGGAAAAWLDDLVEEDDDAGVFDLLEAGAPDLAPGAARRAFAEVVRGAHAVDRPSPLVAFCRSDLDDATKDVVVKWLGETDAERHDLEDEDDEEDGEEMTVAEAEVARVADELDAADDATLEENVETFAAVAAEADARFDGLEGLVVVTARWPHACCPTRSLEAAPGAGALACVLAGDYAGAPTVSRVETRLGLEARAAALARRSLPPCDCARCRFDRREPVGPEELGAVAAAAQRDERYDDALRAFEAILDVLPDDGDALYGRARTHGWMDRWASSARLMREAFLRAPDHPRLRDEVANAAAYHAGPCAPAPKAAFTKLDVGGASAHASAGALVPGCAAVVRYAEDRAAAAGGWTTARHFAVPTTDLPVRADPRILKWFNDQLRRVIFPCVARLYDAKAERLRVVDAFVVKYDSSRRALPVHTDQSAYSITLPLNDRGEYAGGGTYFLEADAALNGDAGSLIVFPGCLEHCGAPTTAGVRYVVVAFLYEDDTDVFDDDFGRTLRDADRRLGASG